MYGRKKTARRRLSALEQFRSPNRIAAVSATPTGYRVTPRGANSHSNRPITTERPGRSRSLRVMAK
ncbi:hypothetical protein Y023_5140 [Burkholderia pseudomallei A79D]|nr:hypothetical protein Y023_5140 [Burkholderia pseudomallei A79D]KGX97320.1 hypothetical protein X997_4823 [Burkholderia pseudomallei A79C]